MGWRYRKSIRVGKYFRINVSRSGIGYSVGVPGARLTFSANGRVNSTVGIPGSGLSYTQTLNNGTRRVNRTVSQPIDTGVGVQRTAESASIDNFQPAEMSELLKALKKARITDKWSNALLIIGIIFCLAFSAGIGYLIFGMITTALGIFLKCMAHIKLPVALDYELDDENAQKHNLRIEAFKDFFNSKKVWQTVSSADVYNRRINAGVSSSVRRNIVSYSQKAPFYIKTNQPIILLNLNSEKALILPDKIIVIKKGKFGAVDYSDITMRTYHQQFVESGVTPRDAMIVGHTWQYVNNNGTPDRRYKNNFQLSICSYSYLEIKSVSGLNIILSASRYDAADKFTLELMSNNTTSTPRMNQPIDHNPMPSQSTSINPSDVSTISVERNPVFPDCAHENDQQPAVDLFVYDVSGHCTGRSDGKPLTDADVAYLIRRGGERHTSAIAQQEMTNEVSSRGLPIIPPGVQNQAYYAASHYTQVRDDLRIMVDSYKMVSSTTDVETFCTRFDLMCEKARALLNAYAKGTRGIKQLNCKEFCELLLSSSNPIKRRFIIDYESSAYTSMEKLKTDKGKANRCKKILADLTAAAPLLAEMEEYDNLIVKTQNYLISYGGSFD